MLWILNDAGAQDVFQDVWMKEGQRTPISRRLGERRIPHTYHVKDNNELRWALRYSHIDSLAKKQ